MPLLPTFDVTTAVGNRINAAFAGQVDENGVALTTVQAYKRWLRWAIVNYVRNHEIEQANQTDSLENDLV